MKKLLMTLAACATALLASAAITTSEGFEGTGLGGFSGTGGEAVPYDSAPSLANYPFADAGSKYCEIDADGTDTLSSPAATGATYFDMYIQFPANASEPDPELDSDAKLAVYVNASSNLVVLAGDGNGATVTNETGTTIAPGAWKRLTIAKVTDGYQVYVDGTAVSENAFTAINDGDPSTVAFTGCGKLDNFVARTTDPFGGAPANWIAKEPDASDPEQYYTDYTDALTAALNGATLTFNGGMDGTAEHPFEIRTADDLKALATAVNAGKSADKCFVQTANIDMANAGAFAGVGVYNADPTAGKPFAGTYDGGNFKICNVDFTQRNYGGVFNQVNGGTIKNLTVSNITCSAFSASANSGEWGGAIVGNAGNGATLQNLVAEGTFAADHPATHNVAGIVIRACGGGENGTLIKDCTNNATLYGAYTKIGGICAITQYKIAGGAVTFDGCVNNGDIISSRTTATGVTGYAGILGYNDDNTVIVNCSNTGSIVNESGANTDKDGAIVGWAYTKDANSVRSLTDQGGNSAAKTDKMLAFISDLADVTGFKYATVANDVATTVTSLSAGNTYLLEGNVAASETPVFTFAEAGTIAFDAALGYTFAGTVTVANSNLFDVTSATEEDVTTYTAAGGTAVASLTKNEETTEYNTIAKALDAAENGDTVNLETDSSEDVSLPTGVSLALNEHTYSGTISAAANGYAVTQVDGVYAVVENTASTWVGESGGLWATASNWSTGAVPDQYTTVTFNGDADVGIGSGNDTRSVAALVVNGNVTFHHDNRNYAYYPSVQTYGNVTGSGTVILERCGLRGNGSEVTVGCDLVFKGDSATSHDSFLQQGPFVINGDVSSTLGRLHLITPVTFNGSVTLGNATITSTVSGGAAPTFNGAVTLGTGATISTYAVTYNDALTIGEGAVVSVGSSTQTYGENFTMTGSGRFIGDTQLPGVKVRESLTQSTWTGICELKGMTIKSVWWITDYGNENSKVCFNNVTTYLYNSASSGSHMVAGIEIGAGGLKVNGIYSSGSWTLPALSGSGTFTVGTAGDNDKNFYFPADCSEFSGSIAFASDTANTRVVFGTTDREFKEKTICVGSDAVVGAGATWTASDEIYLDGIVKASANTSLSTVVGSGKIVYGAKPTGTHAFGEDWSGIGALDYKEDSRIDLADYVNTIAQKCSCDTVEVVEGCTMSLNNYFGADVTPTLKVSGFVTINDGSSTTKRKISNLTGDGVLVFGTKGGMVNYAVDNVVGWNGVITNSASSTLVTNLVSGAGTVVYNVAASTTIGADFGGEVEYAVEPSAEPAVDAESEATVYLNFNYASKNIAPYGKANSTIKLGNLTAENAFFNDGDGTGTGLISSKVVVAGDVTINNAWPLGSADWTSKKVVRFDNRLKVDGALTFGYTQSKEWTGYGYYRADVLDASGAGRITIGNRFALRIDAVDFAEAPSGTDVLVDLTLAGDTAGLLYGPNGVAGEQIPVTVNGEATEQTLVYDAVKGGLVLYVAPAPKVAEVVNGEQFETLAEALAAATDGATVKLLANITLDARVNVAKSVTIDLAGYSITRTAAPNGDNGSAFRVDGAYTVTIKGGAIDCSGVDDATVLANGVFAIDAKNGAALSLTNLTVTVDSKNGACVYAWSGSTVTILDGTYANTTQEYYQYGKFQEAKGMAVNQANVATQLLTIYGGSFKQIDPSLGDDSASGCSTFLASGYVATWNTSNGYWDVAKSAGIDPSQSTTVDVDTTKSEEDQRAEAQAKANTMDVVKTAAASSVDQATWNGYFTKSVEKVGDDWVATATLNPAVVLPVDEVEETPLTDMLESVTEAALYTEKTAASVPTKAGLYYWIAGATEVGATTYTPGTAQLGDGTTKELAMPVLSGENGKAFYKVCVDFVAP